MNRVAKSGRGKRYAEPLPHALHNRGDSLAHNLAAAQAFRRVGLFELARLTIANAGAMRRMNLRLTVLP